MQLTLTSNEMDNLMGVIQHNAIIATSYDCGNNEKIVRAWIQENVANDCKSLFTFNRSFINGYFTVVMNPDGSKEGWPYSDLCDQLRDDFIEFLNKSNRFRYVELSFGEYGEFIVQGNNTNLYSQPQ